MLRTVHLCASIGSLDHVQRSVIINQDPWVFVVTIIVGMELIFLTLLGTLCAPLLYGLPEKGALVICLPHLA